MKRGLLISGVTGVITGVTVFYIARIEPLVFALIFGTINAAVVLAVYAIA